MPESRSRRTTPSKQERQQLQREARAAQQGKRQRTGLKYVASLGLVAILFVFGVLGQNLRNDDKDNKAAKTPVTSSTGQPGCPRADGSSERKVFFEAPPGRCIDATRVYDATIETSAGTMTAEIYPSRAFNAANNFIFLARYHFYDGLPIHRVLKDTFAQTGDPVAPNVSGPGYIFDDDGLPSSSSQYVKGAMLFAHEAANLNGSQFLFITGERGGTLKPAFPLFGQVKKGFAVLDKINAAATDNSEVQNIRYVIRGISVEEHDS
jgi:cyclophilin family peptidyl-prolyl cis-trans isomerase